MCEHRLVCLVPQVRVRFWEANLGFHCTRKRDGVRFFHGSYSATYSPIRNVPSVPAYVQNFRLGKEDWINVYPIMSDKSLKIIQGSTIMSTTHNRKEPNQWKVMHYANVGSSEEFVDQFSGEFLELIDASLIFEPQRQDLKEAILTIMFEGLMPAFEHLKKIRASVGQAMPVLNRMQLYEDSAVCCGMRTKTLCPRQLFFLVLISVSCSKKTRISKRA